MDPLRISLLDVDRRNKVHDNSFRIRVNEVFSFGDLHEIRGSRKVKITSLTKFHLRENKSGASEENVSSDACPLFKDLDEFLSRGFAGCPGEDPDLIR